MYRVFISLIASIILPALVAGCAGPEAELPNVSKVEIEAEKQKQIAFDFERYIHDLDRLKSVGHKVLSANADICGENTAPRPGFEAATYEDVKKRWQRVAAKMINLSSKVSVIQIVKSGPAYRAGLRRGDHIIRLDGKPVPYGRGATQKFYKHLARAAEAAGPIRFEVMRGKVRKSLAVNPDTSCAYPVQIADDASKNAYTDGSKIVVHRGLLKLASTDDELALIVGHELAHITAGHLSKKKTNQYLGMAGGLAVDAIFAVAGVNTGGSFTRSLGNAGASKYSQEFEKEADYMGMYYMAKAGYLTAGVEGFWRKMSAEDTRSIVMAGSHPTSPERFLLIRRTHDEIALKRRKGEKLIPNRRPRA